MTDDVARDLDAECSRLRGEVSALTKRMLDIKAEAVREVKSWAKAAVDEADDRARTLSEENERLRDNARFNAGLLDDAVESSDPGAYDDFVRDIEHVAARLRRLAAPPSLGTGGAAEQGDPPKTGESR